MYSPQQINALFKDLADRHLQINSYGIGSPDNIATAELELYVGADKNTVTYPLMWAVPVEARIQDDKNYGKITRMNYNILFLDLPHHDLRDEQDILSDQLLIAQDIWNELSWAGYRENFVLDRNSANMKPIVYTTAVSGDNAIGWQLNLTLQVFNLRDRCAIPFASGAIGVAVVTGSTHNCCTYIGLTDTDDLSYAGKLGFVPAVMSGFTSLRLADIAPSVNKISVRAGSTVNIAGTYTNGTAGVGAKITVPLSTDIDVFDTVNIAIGDDVLIKDQTSLLENGVYDRTSATELTRKPGSDTAAGLDKQVVFVVNGSSGINGNLSSYFTQQVALPTPGTDDVIYLKGLGTIIGSAISRLKNVLFVDPNGNDATALRGNIGRPWKTIDAAVAAALSGYTIHVFPGAYTPASNLAKQGVSFFFEDATLTKTTAGHLFDLTGMTGSFIIKGNATFIVSASGAEVIHTTAAQVINIDVEFTDATSSAGGCILIDTNSTSQRLRFRSIVAGSGKGIYCKASTTNVSTKVDIAGTSIQSTGHGVQLESVFLAYHKISIDTVNSSAGVGLYSDTCLFASHVEISQINGVGFSIQVGVVKASGQLAFNVAVTFNAVSINTTTVAAGIQLVCTFEGEIAGTATSLFNCAMLFRGNISTPVTINGGFNIFNCYGGYPVFPAFNHVGGDTILTYFGDDLTILNNAGNANAGSHRLNVTGGKLKVNGTFNERYFGAARTAHTVNGGTLILHDVNIITSDTAFFGGGSGEYTVVKLISGTLIMNAGTMIWNRIPNGAGVSHCVKKEGGILVLDGAVLVSDDATSNSILCATNQTIKIYSRTKTNRATGGAGVITYEVGTVADLLVDANVIGV